MDELPPLRRIVTGHTVDGKAVVESDKTLSPVDPRAANSKSLTDIERNMPEGGGFINIWKTNKIPAIIQGPWDDIHGATMPLADKKDTIVRAVDMPAGLSSPMHRTVSLDFGVLLSGENVSMELDDSVEVSILPGDVIVQRGTIHAWHNRGRISARLLFILIPAEEVIIKGDKMKPTEFGVN
jgi:hypothetical protein